MRRVKILLFFPVSFVGINLVREVRGGKEEDVAASTRKRHAISFEITIFSSVFVSSLVQTSLPGDSRIQIKFWPCRLLVVLINLNYAFQRRQRRGGNETGKEEEGGGKNKCRFMCDS